MEDVNYPLFIEKYSNYLYTIKSLSKEYINSVISTLSQFLEYINLCKFHNKYETIKKITLNDISCLSNTDIYNFIYYLAENNYKTRCRILKIEHLRGFFDYLYRIKHTIFLQPFKQVKKEKNLYLQIPNYLTFNESKQLLQLYKDSKKIKEIRINAMLHLFLNCGLRISEMSKLNISDFDLKSNSFKIDGKGKKERIGYLNQITKEALQKYLDIRETMHPKYLKDKDALFISNKKERIGVKAIRSDIKKTYELANINSTEYSVHTLRHTCATLMYQNGTDINTIRELLGHVNIETTEIYTHTHDKDVLKAMIEHPLSQFKMKDAEDYSNEKIS